MNRKECYQLLGEMMELDYHGEVKKLANGEHVVVINSVYIWSKSDWRAYKRGTLPAQEAKKVEASA